MSANIERVGGHRARAVGPRRRGDVARTCSRATAAAAALGPPGARTEPNRAARSHPAAQLLHRFSSHLTNVY
ncbi:unnamed protein product, partial [Iphiclides podalirius]